MESKEEEKTASKYNKLEENDKTVTDQVELIQNKFTKNIASPFINQSKAWTDES